MNAPTSGAVKHEGKAKRRMFSLRPSFIHHEQSYLRTNEYLKRSSNEHILTRTALHLGSGTLKLFLCIFSLPEKYNQTTLFLPVHSYSRSPHTHRTSDDDVVCGPLPSLRGPGLQGGASDDIPREGRGGASDTMSERLSNAPIRDLLETSKAFTEAVLESLEKYSGRGSLSRRES